MLADAAALDSLVVTDAAEAAAIWRIREDGAGLAARTSDGRPAHAGWEDAAVPVGRLGDYLREFEELLDSHGLQCLPYGHFGDGCVHGRIDFPFGTGQDGGRAQYRAFVEDAARLVARYGGSLSGEHGDGRARSELLPLMYSPAVLSLFEQVKAVFDPDDVLNPGVLVRPAPVDEAIRTAAAPRVPRGAGAGLPARRRRLLRRRPPLHRRGQVPGRPAGHRRRDVPVVAGHPGGEGHHPRPGAGAAGDARARRSGARLALARGARRARPLPVLQGVLARLPDRCRHGELQGGGAAPVLPPPAPPALALHARPAPVLGRPRREGARAGQRASSHRRLGGRLAKWGAGMDQRRTVPPFARQTFRQQWAARSSGDDGHSGRTTGPAVALWVDSFTDHFAPEVAFAAARVLEAAGYEVQVPGADTCCGLTWITTGQLDRARAILGATVRALAPLAEAGVPIVGVEPSCTAALRSESLEVVGGPEAERVAGATRTLAELLTSTPGWEPPSLAGVEVVAQPHCHHAAVLGWATDARLLERAGATVTRLGGCCGLAGNWGVERGHHDVSVTIAEQQLLPAVRVGRRRRRRPRRRVLLPHPARPAGWIGKDSTWRSCWQPACLDGRRPRQRSARVRRRSRRPAGRPRPGRRAG